MRPGVGLCCEAEIRRLGFEGSRSMEKCGSQWSAQRPILQTTQRGSGRLTAGKNTGNGFGCEVRRRALATEGLPAVPPCSSMASTGWAPAQGWLHCAKEL